MSTFAELFQKKAAERGADVRAVHQKLIEGITAKLKDKGIDRNGGVEHSEFLSPHIEVALKRYSEEHWYRELGFGYKVRMNEIVPCGARVTFEVNHNIGKLRVDIAP
jgi:hypothetical protein